MVDMVYAIGRQACLSIDRTQYFGCRARASAAIRECCVLYGIDRRENGFSPVPSSSGEDSLRSLSANICERVNESDRISK